MGTPAAWMKSSLSLANGNCVEVAFLSGGAVAVRNSRDPDGPVLEFTPDEWTAFIGGARNGEFGPPEDNRASAACNPGSDGRRYARVRRRARDGQAWRG